MQKQDRQHYSLVQNSARACSRRCSPSPATCRSPRQEDGTSLTPAGSQSSVQPPGLFIWSEVGVMQTSIGRPPSSGTLGIKNNTQEIISH